MYFGNMFDPRQPPRATPLRPSPPSPRKAQEAYKDAQKLEDERRKKKKKAK